MARPEIIDEQTWDLWTHISNQFRFSFKGPIGLDWNQVITVARIMNIRITKEIFQKLLALELTPLKHLEESINQGKDKEQR